MGGCPGLFGWKSSHSGGTPPFFLWGTPVLWYPQKLVSFLLISLQAIMKPATRSLLPFGPHGTSQGNAPFKRKKVFHDPRFRDGTRQSNRTSDPSLGWGKLVLVFDSDTKGIPCEVTQ